MAAIHRIINLLCVSALLKNNKNCEKDNTMNSTIRVFDSENMVQKLQSPLILSGLVDILRLKLCSQSSKHNAEPWQKLGKKLKWKGKIGQVLLGIVHVILLKYYDTF